MSEIHYCWRCKIEVPFLDEEDWQLIQPLLRDSKNEIMEHRKKHGLSLEDTLERLETSAEKKYLELTGFKETNVNAIWHHRRAQFGEPCWSCGKLLRTPNAKHCAECGEGVKYAV